MYIAALVLDSQSADRGVCRVRDEFRVARGSRNLQYYIMNARCFRKARQGSHWRSDSSKTTMGEMMTSSDGRSAMLSGPRPCLSKQERWTFREHKMTVF